MIRRPESRVERRPLPEGWWVSFALLGAAAAVVVVVFAVVR